MAEPAGSEPRRARAQPGGLPAIVLALVVHAAFFALLFFGVSWQSRPTPPVEVEVWDKLPTAAVALPPVKVPQRIEPEAAPPEPAELKPPPKIEKRPEEVKPPPPKVDPEIAERAERAKREREKREREKQEELQRQKQAERQKAEAKKREEEKRRREEEQARLAAQKAAEAAAAAQRAEIDRYINAIKVKIRGRANIPDSVRGEPEVHVLIRILPGGEVLDIVVKRRSGNPAYDSAIERGIRSASPLPVPPPNSELFPQFRELNLQIRHER